MAHRGLAAIGLPVGVGDETDCSVECQGGRDSKRCVTRVWDNSGERVEFALTLPVREDERNRPRIREVLRGSEGPDLMTSFELTQFSNTTRGKLVSILLAMAIFAFLGGLTTVAVGRPVSYGIINAVLVGLSVGLFEEFYVQTLRGRWLRRMHPLGSIGIYTLFVVAIFLVAIHLSHLMLGSLGDLPIVYARLPFAIPEFVAFSVVGVIVMRVVHFIGAGTLFHLTVGTYHRPVPEPKVLMFLDINGSTALAARLGAFRITALVGKFLFDISKPITDFGGDIYLYKGDGLIALWDWNTAVRGNKILRAVDGIFAAVRRENDEYHRQFDVAPTFRIGIHGGNVVVSEQGDAKRAIGVYGDPINIAARMEEAARTHNVACVISGYVAEALDDREKRILPIGNETVKGISAPIPIYEYRPRDERAPTSALSGRSH
jgi:adenylate cyclase